MMRRRALGRGLEDLVVDTAGLILCPCGEPMPKLKGRDDVRKCPSCAAAERRIEPKRKEYHGVLRDKLGVDTRDTVTVEHMAPARPNAEAIRAFDERRRKLVGGAPGRGETP